MKVTRSFVNSYVLYAITTALLSAELCLAGDIQAITVPSKDVMLSFVRTGRIAEVMVKEGDMVSVGNLLVRQNDAAEQIRLAQLKAQAEDITDIEIAEAALEQRKVNLEKVKDMKDRKVATDWELREAKLDELVTRLKLQLACFEHQQNQRKYDEAKIQVERMSMASPISGRIERISVERGESVKDLDEVIRVVKIDPLWMNVPVPLDEVWRLKIDQEGIVKFPGSNPDQGKCRIIHIAAVADAASNTRTVRVEVPNRSSRPAGEHVGVSFPPSARSSNTPKNERVSEIVLDNNNKE